MPSVALGTLLTTNFIFLIYPIYPILPHTKKTQSLRPAFFYLTIIAFISLTPARSFRSCIMWSRRKNISLRTTLELIPIYNIWFSRRISWVCIAAYSPTISRQYSGSLPSAIFAATYGRLKNSSNTSPMSRVRVRFIVLLCPLLR